MWVNSNWITKMEDELKASEKPFRSFKVQNYTELELECAPWKKLENDI